MVAVIFHCDPIKLVLAHYIGLPLDGFQKLGVAPARFRPDDWQITGLLAR